MNAGARPACGRLGCLPFRGVQLLGGSRLQREPSGAPQSRLRTQALDVVLALSFVVESGKVAPAPVFAFRKRCRRGGLGHGPDGRRFQRGAWCRWLRGPDLSADRDGEEHDRENAAHSDHGENDRVFRGGLTRFRGMPPPSHNLQGIPRRRGVQTQVWGDALRRRRPLGESLGSEPRQLAQQHAAEFCELGRCVLERGQNRRPFGDRQGEDFGAAAVVLVELGGEVGVVDEAGELEDGSVSDRNAGELHPPELTRTFVRFQLAAGDVAA